VAFQPSSEEDSDEAADDADREVAAEELFSAVPTMMTGEARNMLLSGDPEGLAAYKRRSYRKMEADGPEKVRQPVQCRGPCAIGTTHCPGRGLSVRARMRPAACRRCRGNAL
jgi:hypothetical protein